MLRWLSVLVLALALVLVAAGCGGGDEESASDETTVTETTTTETTDEGTTDDGTTDAGDLSDILGDEDCAALVAAGATFAQAFSGAGDSASAEELEELASKVPDEIAAEVQVLAEWYADYAAKLEDIGIEAGETPSAEQLTELQAALASTNTGELTAASERLSAWADENCSAATG